MSSDSDPPPNESQPRTLFSILSVIAKAIEDFWVSVSRALLIGLTVALSIAFWPLVSDRKFVIGEFSVPEELRSKGITGPAIARRLYQHITEVQRIAKATVAAQQHDAQAFASTETVVKGADIKFLGAEINLGTLLIQLRTLLGKTDTQIVGEVTIDPENIRIYRLDIHAIGEHAWTKRTAPGSNLDKLVENIAIQVVEQFDPLSAGYYYYLRPKDVEHEKEEDYSRAIAFADGFQTEKNPQFLWATLLRALAERDLLADPRAAVDALCRAVEHTPSFTPAWRWLGDSLRAASADSNLSKEQRQKAAREAEDVALRLAGWQPSEPEGWRQLGNLYQDCTRAPHDKEDVPGYFKRALALGERRSSKNSNYLTLVDFARWHYSHLGLTEAENYFRQAQALGPDQQSVYTTFARTLAYPRLNEHEGAFSRRERYLMARTKAMTALRLPGRMPFANFVMGELVTDEAVQNHIYASGDKQLFKEAAQYLQTAEKTVNWPLYKAFHARALAGQGKFHEAKDLLSNLQSSPEAEWIYAEVLYNESLGLSKAVPSGPDAQPDSIPKLPQMSDTDRQRFASKDLNPALPDPKALLIQARDHLKKASDGRTCGPRSDVIQDLLKVVQEKLKEPGRQRADVDTGGTSSSEGVIEKRTIGPGSIKFESEITASEPRLTDPPPEGSKLDMETRQPEHGAALRDPEKPKLALVTTSLDSAPGKPDVFDVAPIPAAVNASETLTSPAAPKPANPKPEVGVEKFSANRAQPDPIPACPGWEKLTFKELSPWISLEERPDLGAVFFASH
jgi:tetratricopeptide (TPR) repeat protein